MFYRSKTRAIIAWILIISLIAIAVLFTSCNGSISRSISPSVSSTPTSQNHQLVEVVSVKDIAKAPNPGGPDIEIILKNVSSEPVIDLNAIFTEPLYRSWKLQFNVSQSNPLLPGSTTSVHQILIGGGWGANIQYSLTINGTLKSGRTFNYAWEP